MSSLHQDRLLVEGSGPVTGTAAALPTTRGTSRRAVGTTEKKATSKVPTRRLGTAQRGGATQSTAASTAAPRATRGAGAKAAAASGALASRAKAATVKAATAKAATARAATAKAATAARAAAVTTVANHTAGVRSARAAAAAKATPITKARAAKPAATKTAPAAKAAVAKTAPAAKAAVAKTTPAAKPAAAKTAPAAKAAVAKTAPAAKPAAAKTAPAAKPAAAKSPVAKAPAAPTPAANPSTGKATAVRSVRPTPHKRVPAADNALFGLVPVTDVAALGTPEAADVVVLRKDVPAEPTGGRLSLFLRRRAPRLGRRPALYLTGAIVGAISLGAFSAQEPAAQATAAMSQSVSVAEQLGIEAAPTVVVDADATERLGELAASRNTRDAEQAAALEVQAEADRIAVEAAAEAARPKAVFPITGARLTSPFGPRWGTLHAGVDLAAPMLTPEYAAMDGVVLEAGPASGFGLAVYIQHENGDVTVYGHMEKILVEAGQVVRAGDTVALVGNRGQSTGPHLHFEVHEGGLDGRKIDPMAWLRERGVEMG